MVRMFFFARSGFLGFGGFGKCAVCVFDLALSFRLLGNFECRVSLPVCGTTHNYNYLWFGGQRGLD